MQDKNGGGDDDDDDTPKARRARARKAKVRNEARHWCREQCMRALEYAVNAQ